MKYDVVLFLLRFFYMNMRSNGFYDSAVVLSMPLRIVCRPYDEYDLCPANRGPHVHYLLLASKHIHDIRSKIHADSAPNFEI